MAFDSEALRQAVNRTRERALSELGAFHQTDEAAFMRMVLGVLRIIRQSGAFEDSAFDMFLKEEGKSYFLTNDFRKWLPGKSAGRNVPRFPYGPRPEVSVFKDANAEYEYLIKRLKEMQEKGIDLSRWFPPSR